MEVVPGSPAHIAGLQPEHDYLLGTAERVFKDPDILFEEVTAHLDQPMSFYVYNTKTDEVRCVSFVCLLVIITRYVLVCCRSRQVHLYALCTP